MTTINWEREPGDSVEEFVEALILTTVNSRAVRITPSRGDKGIDILAPVGDQFDVYQVKRYTRPFGKSSNEEKSIEGSWKRFVDKILPTYPIRRWNLVMPWNPTTERHSWLLDKVTAGVEIERDWLGRGSLDVWAASNPGLVEYFFGNGRERMMELLASALNGARDIPDISGDALLDAALTRERELARQLDQVDPFYRYEIAIRHGRLTESAVDQFSTIDRNAALVTFRELDGDFYQQVSLYPTCHESTRLRPISTTFSVDSSTDQETLRVAHDMLAYGTEPDRPIPVNVVRSEGPPGANTKAGPALLYVINMDQPAHPDLELRLGKRRLAFTHIVVTHGFQGVQVSGDAEGGVFKVTITFDAGGKTREIAVETTPIGGRLPHIVIPGLEFLRDWTGGETAVLALPYGKELLSFGTLPDSGLVHEQANDWLKIARALITLQPKASVQMLMPQGVTGREAQAIDEAARLVGGEIIESEWKGFKFQLGDPQRLRSTSGEEPLFQFLSFLPFSVDFGGNKYELDGVIAHWGVAQLADPSVVDHASAGDTVAIVPGPENKLFRQYGHKGPTEVAGTE